MYRWLRIVPLVVSVSVLACAGNRPVQGPTDLTMLSGSEITHFDNALQAVRTMRSQWLRERAPSALFTPGGNLRVYCDGLAVGGVDVLQSMSTQGIVYIRFFNGIEASARWGLGHENGVIYVSNRLGLGPGALH